MIFFCLMHICVFQAFLFHHKFHLLIQQFPTWGMCTPRVHGKSAEVNGNVGNHKNGLKNHKNAKNVNVILYQFII